MPTIGIDLGTTNSCVAAYKEGNIEVIANDLGFRTTPSCVAFNDEERLIGKPAKDRMSSNPENTVFYVKRLIGLTYNDPVVAENIKHWGFTVTNQNNKPNIQIKYLQEKKSFCSEQISAMVLEKMKETAEDYLGEKINDAVITVPAHFNDAQRKATRDAGTIAGLNVLCMINEPTAAAIAYGLNKKDKKDLNVLVFDFGGGTFDVTILSIEDGNFEVKATGGDTHLGGEDINSRMVEYFAEEFLKKHKIDLRNNKRSMSYYLLSVSKSHSLSVDALFEGIDFYSSITRSKFENMNADLFLKTIRTVEKTLVDAKMEKHQIDDVVLVGGSTRIPMVQKQLQDFFEGKAMHKTINPDEAVAIGAAAHAAMLSGENNDLKHFTFHDVTPLSLGIKAKGRDMLIFIPRNTKLPYKVTKTRTNMEENQTTISLPIYEGEHPLAKQNNLLAKFKITGVTPAPPKQTKIDVCFDIDASGILYVSAKEKGTGLENVIVITKSGKLSESEIDEMIAEAEKFKEDERIRKKRCEEMYSLENYAYNIKDIIDEDEFKDEYSEDEKNLMLEKCTEILDWLDNNKSKVINLTDLAQKREELQETCESVLNKN